MTHRKGTPPILLGALVILLMLLAAAGTAYWAIYMRVTPIEDEQPGGDVEPDTPQVLDLTRQWKISIEDTVAENTTAAGFVAIYSLDDVLVENNAFTGGMATTSKYFTSGQQYNVLVAADGFVNVWKSATVPMGATADDAYLHSSVSIIDLGTFSPKAMAPDLTYLLESGSSVADNLDKSDASKPTVTFTINNTEDDSGFMASRNPLTDVNYKAVFYMYLENGSYEDIVISGVTARYEARSSRRTWYKDIPINSIIYDKDSGGTVISDGTYTIAMTFDLTGWTNATDVGCLYGIAIYTSEDYYAYYGSWGTPSAQTYSCFTIQQ